MEYCSLFIKTDANELVNLTGVRSRESVSAKKEKRNSVVFQMGEGLIGRAAEKEESQYCSDCLNDKRFINKYADDEMPGSIISVPVKVGSELFGILNVSHSDAHYFSDWHIRLLEIYKNMLGQLIANFRLFKEMDQRISEKTQHLEKALEEAEILKERYENLSMVDSLTKLYNRRFFYEQIAVPFAKTLRYGDPLCLLLLDLDAFKRINDAYGHHAGDKVLIDVANTLKETVRGGDVLARFGGEEFVVAFSNTDNDKGLVFAERIRKAIELLRWNFDGHEVAISASIGVCCVLCQKNNLEDNTEHLIDTYIHYADLAMYAAKARGKNQVAVFNKEML
jgi:diguanylate cyclase (GGDEF)-like protein